jgi:hypothetical protein
MQELLHQLITLTTFQYIFFIATVGLFLYGFISVPLYVSIHSFEPRNFKYYAKMLAPLMVAIVMGIYSSFDIHRAWNNVTSNNSNYTITRENNILHIVSNNKNLANEDVDIVIENDEYLYVKYNKKIIEIKKDELKLSD